MYVDILPSQRQLGVCIALVWVLIIGSCVYANTDRELFSGWAEIQDGTGMVVFVKSMSKFGALIVTCEGREVQIGVEWLKPTKLNCDSEPPAEPWN